MKRFFVTDADGVIIRQGMAPDDQLDAQILEDGVRMYCSEVEEHEFVDDTTYSISPESGGFVPRPGASEPPGGFTPSSGTLDVRID